MPEDNGMKEEVYSPDNLIAGGKDIVTESTTLLTGQNLTRGALLGKVTASGKHVLSLAAAVDGSEVPDAILAKDTDATDEDLVTAAYLAGEFNEDALTYGAGHTAASVKDALRAKGIFLKSTVA